MKDLLKACAIVGTIAFVVIAGILATKGVNGWGWFLFFAFFSVLAW